MDLQQSIRSISKDDLAAAVEEFLSGFITPVFGGLPKSEIELLVLTLFNKIGAVSSDPEVYELQTKLKVTRRKAQNLIYQRELRRFSVTELDNRVKQMLKRPIIQKQGELFVLEIENPLVSDHLRSKVHKLGFVSDGSFSPNLVKLPLNAVVALIDQYVVDKDKEKVRRALINAGAPDDSFKGVLNSVLKKVAIKVASESGEALVEKASDYLEPIIDSVTKSLTKKVAEVFPKPQE